MAGEFKDLTLETAGGGAAVELFERELEAVVDNIADIETDPEAKRTITLKFTFKPFKGRKGAAIEVESKAGLAPARAADGIMWIGKEGDRMVALTQNPEQGEIFDDEGAEDDGKVVPMERQGTDD